MPETPSATPPRLASADPGAQPGYAPISATAAASLGVAVLFVVVLGAMGVSAFLRRQSLIVEPLLILPAVAVVLAFVARRQIRAAEGTRTGERYANAGWWVAVVGGLGYVAYLGAVEFAVRRNAEREFVAWADNLKDLDPTNPKDPALYAAVYKTLLPGVRTFSSKDVARMDESQRDAVAMFRQTDLVRVCQRNRGAVEVRPQGLRSWEQKPAEVTCTLSAALVTPEGEHALLVPMRAVADDKRARQWQVMPAPDGYLKGKKLTRYGWLVEQVEASAGAAAREFLARLSQPGQAPLAYLEYVDPAGDQDRARQLVKALVPAGGLAGGPAAITPLPPGWVDHLTGKVLGRPDGTPLPPDDAPRFLYLWNSPGRVVPAGAFLRGNQNAHPVLVLADGRAEFRFPIEVGLSQGYNTGSAAVGRVVLRDGPGSDLAAVLAKARVDGAGRPTDQRPADLPAFRANWRVARIESDLKAVQPAPQPGAGGGMGMPGG